MITCMSLVVGGVWCADRQDVLNQCTDFLKLYSYLRKKGTEFVIDGTVYAVLSDTYEIEGVLYALFNMYDDDVEMGVA